MNNNNLLCEGVFLFAAVTQIVGAIELLGTYGAVILVSSIAGLWLRHKFVKKIRSFRKYYLIGDYSQSIFTFK